MDEGDFWIILGILGLMSVSQWLRGKTMDMQHKRIAGLEADVAFLRDLARQTDTLRGDNV